ncbi:G protein alpha q subunit-like isoform X1 [Anastrepha ludens]|uniref:G protein alpha q subunit-like isoform X1 n=2 Tax=Anastrepha ludens TaxID=28586 RepID=UPI0023B2026E|nr:G protein alpha q subunit-like isoform X1 [Anastrepha ludens]
MLRSSLETALRCSCCYSTPSEVISEEEFNEQKISEELEKYDVELNAAKKLLLLGTGEAGKSTFFKQMHINYGDGFSDEAKHEYKRVIHQNIFTAMQSMLHAMDVLRIPFDKSEHAILAKTLLATNIETVTTLEASAVLTIKCLWGDAGVQKCYDQRRKYQLIDSAKYFLNKLDCVAHPDYIPNNDDILHSRLVTTGIVEHVFDTQRNKPKRNSVKRPLLRVIDVGGQRTERQKWLQCFNDVTAIIFLTSLSEYDQTLYEAPGLKRMDESRDLFRFIVASTYFKESSIILFLNKQDILEEKIMSSHLVDYYPDFNGPKRNAVAAKAFIGKMFEATLQDKDKQLYMHYTCATDTKNFRVVFLVVQDTIMRSYLNSLGID